MAGENVIRKDVVQIGFDVIGNPIKEIQSMVNNLTGGAKKAMQGVDGITKEAKAAADSVKDIGESAKQASNTAKTMSEPIKKTAENAKDASKNLESMAKSIEKTGNGKIKSIPEAIKSSATAAKQFAASLKANIADGATKGFQKLKNTVQSVKNIKLTDLTSGLLRGVNNLKDKFSGAAKAAKEIETNMDGAKSSIDDATDEAGKLGSKLKSVASAITKALGGLTLAAGAGAIGLGTAVVNSFGELEQNIGGAESVFQDLGKTINDMSTKTMVLDKKTKELTETTTNLGKLSEDAYKTMGISQSEYLATANKMGALFQGSGLDQQRALDLTTQAMQRAADMASVMGIDQASALESVTGAAKGNYTINSIVCYSSDAIVSVSELYQRCA